MLFFNCYLMKIFHLNLMNFVLNLLDFTILKQYFYKCVNDIYSKDMDKIIKDENDNLLRFKGKLMIF